MAKLKAKPAKLDYLETLASKPGRLTIVEPDGRLVQIPYSLLKESDIVGADGRVAEYPSVEGLDRPPYEQDFLDGNQPAWERGVELRYLEDDGSVEFANRHARLLEAGWVVTNP